MEASNGGVSEDGILDYYNKKRCIEDRISNLPDAILQLILSFLDTKHAVQTSILSKKWNRLWTSLPILSFNSDTFLYPNRLLDDSQSEEDVCLPDVQFMNLVDQVFIHRNGSNINMFRLICDGPAGYLKPKRLYSWVLASVRRHVHELDLSVGKFFVPSLPRCLFTCVSLTTLLLKFSTAFLFAGPLVLPSSISLPSLRKLHLCCISFLNDTLSDAPFSKCPVLESLVISHCEHFKEKAMNISNPLLEHLRVDHCEPFWCKLNIYAPKLTSFSVNGDVDIDYSLGGFTSVHKAEICFGFGEQTHSDKCTRNMVYFLRTFGNVETLTISGPAVEYVSGARSALESLATQFPNLRFMHFHSRLRNVDISAIMYLLEISPNTEKLTLEWTTDLSDPVEKEEYPEIGQFKLFNLKLVEMRNVLGLRRQLEFLETLLSKCVVLEKLSIFMCKTLPDREETLVKFSKDLQSIPRASSSIMILIV